MRLRKGLLADVAGTLATEVGAIAVVLGFWPFEPQRVHIPRSGAGRAVPAVASTCRSWLLGRLALGAPKGLGHLYQVVPLGWATSPANISSSRRWSCVRPFRVRAIRLDCTKHAHALSRISLSERVVSGAGVV